MIILLPLLVSLIGLVLFLLAKTNADAKKIGEYMFWVGLLAFLIIYHGQPLAVR